MGVRSRYVLYLLVGMELSVYYGFKWLMKQIKKSNNKDFRLEDITYGFYM